MKFSLAVCPVILLCACAQPPNEVRVAPDTTPLNDEALGPGHFRIFIVSNGFADQQTVDALFAKRAQELCAGAFEPLHIGYGGRDAPRDSLAGVARGMLPLHSEVVCVRP